MFKPAFSARSLSARPGSRFLAVSLVAGFAFLAVIFGLVSALYPPSFTAKAAAVLLGPVALLVSMAAARIGQTAVNGRMGRTFINLWIFLLGAMPAYLPFKFGALPGLNPLRLAFAAVMLLWLYSLVTSASLRATLRTRIAHSRGLFLLLTGFLIWQVLTALVGDEPLFSLYYILKVLLPAYFWYLVVITFYRNFEDIQRSAFGLTLGAIVTCIFGIIEWRTQTNIFLRFLPVSAEDLAGLDWIIVDKSRGGDYRISANFAHPLVLGEFICMVLPFVVALAFSAAKRTHRVIAIISLPLLLLTIYLSYTRSALIATAAVLVTMGLIFGIRSAAQTRRAGLAMLGWMVMVTAISTAVVMASSVGYLAKGRTKAEEGSSIARVLMLSRGQHLLAEQPIQGYGPGLAAAKIGLLPGQRNLTIDSYFLTLAIESGGMGLIVFISAMAVALWRTAVAGIHTADPNAWMMAALTAAIVASMILKIVLSLTHNLDFLFVVIALGVVGNMLAASTKPQSLGVPNLRKTPQAP